MGIMKRIQEIQTGARISSIKNNHETIVTLMDIERQLKKARKEHIHALNTVVAYENKIPLARNSKEKLNLIGHRDHSKEIAEAIAKEIRELDDKYQKLSLSLSQIQH